MDNMTAHMHQQAGMELGRIREQQKRERQAIAPDFTATLFLKDSDGNPSELVGALGAESGLDHLVLFTMSDYERELGILTRHRVYSEEITQKEYQEQMGQAMADNAPPCQETYQYYYKQTGCKAANPESHDCICWHNEGTGPFKDAKHDDTPRLQWRETPV